MNIQNINSTLGYDRYNNTREVKAVSNPQIYVTNNNGLSQLANNNIAFQGFFGNKNNIKKTEEFSQKDIDDNISNELNDSKYLLNGNDQILSLKVADTLHRVDDKNILIIGDKNSLFFKNFVKRTLEDEKPFFPNPKNIENMYLIQNEKISSPIIMAKKSDKDFYIYGDCKVLSKNDKYSSYSHDPIKYEDVLELNDGVKLKLIKTPSESNIRMYEKFPIDDVFNSRDFLDKKSSIEEIDELLSTQCNNCKTEKEKQKVDKHNSIPLRTFDDVAGMDDSVAEIKKKVLYPMLYPDAFKDTKNKGVILYGEPGTGKTLLALSLIGEAKKRKDKDLYLVQLDASSLKKSLVGESEGLLRGVFKKAVDNQPSLLFIDEIDSLFPNRGSDSNNVHDNGMVSQGLTLIEDIEKNDDKVYIIGATNRPDNIDPAIKRSGRLGNLIEIKKPNEKGCCDILNLYLKNKPVDENFDREKFSKSLYKQGATGADIAKMVNDARDNMYERTGIFNKMEQGTFENSDLDNLKYIEEDFKLEKEDTKSKND